MTNEEASLPNHATSSATSSGSTHSLQGVLTGQEVDRRLVEVGLKERGHDEAWANGIDPYAVGGMLPGGGLGHPENAMLGRDVGTGHRKADLAQDRGHVDHRAATATPHCLDSRALGVENAVEIHPDHLVPGGVAVLSRRFLLPANACVGHDDVDPAQGVRHVLHRGVDLIGIGHIDDRRTRGSPVLLQLGYRSLQQLRLQIPQTDSGARAGQRMGTGEADARCPSSDDGDLVVKLVVDHLLLRIDADTRCASPPTLKTHLQ